MRKLKTKNKVDRIKRFDKQHEMMFERMDSVVDAHKKMVAAKKRLNRGVPSVARFLFPFFFWFFARAAAGEKGGVGERGRKRKRMRPPATAKPPLHLPARSARDP